MYKRQLLSTPSKFASHARSRISVEKFEQQILYLKKRYQLISLSEYTQHLLTTGSAPASSVCITFDDGYGSVFEHAWPILRKHNVAATVFCTTRFVNEQLLWHDQVPLWIDKASKCQIQSFLKKSNIGVHEDKTSQLIAIKKRLKTLSAEAFDALMSLMQLKSPPNIDDENTIGFRLMGWEKIKTLHENGIEVGNHTSSHMMLGNATPDRVEREINNCADMLQQVLGVKANKIPFAYPNGQIEDAPLEAQRCVKARQHYAGFLAADSDQSINRYLLPRVNIGYEDCDLAAKCAKQVQLSC